jgi:hypothetical protein
MEDYHVEQELCDLSLIQYQRSALAISHSQVCQQIDDQNKSHFVLELIVLNSLKFN